jgi:hypothetical protein
MACVVFQKAKAAFETKQCDGSRRLVSGAYVDFMSALRCVMRNNPQEAADEVHG